MTLTQKQAFIQNQWVPAITFLEPMETASLRAECSNLDPKEWRLVEIEVPKEHECGALSLGSVPIIHLAYLTAKKDKNETLPSSPPIHPADRCLSDSFLGGK